MKHLFSSLFALLLFIVPAHARLGEDIGDCMARYGDPVRSDIQPGEFVPFLKNSISIYAGFNSDGLCDVISFQLLTEDGTPSTLNTHQIAHLITLNLGDDFLQHLHDGLTTWTDPDQIHFASITKDGTLIIGTADGLQRSIAAEKAAQRKTLDGF